MCLLFPSIALINIYLSPDSQVVSSLKYHTKPVLCLSVDDKYIITGSEDKTLCVYDRRAACIYKVLQVPFMLMSFICSWYWRGCPPKGTFPMYTDNSTMQNLGNKENLPPLKKNSLISKFTMFMYHYKINHTLKILKEMQLYGGVESLFFFVKKSFAATSLNFHWWGLFLNLVILMI